MTRPCPGPLLLSHPGRDLGDKSPRSYRGGDLTRHRPTQNKHSNSIVSKSYTHICNYKEGFLRVGLSTFRQTPKCSIRGAPPVQQPLVRRVPGYPDRRSCDRGGVPRAGTEEPRTYRRSTGAGPTGDEREKRGPMSNEGVPKNDRPRKPKTRSPERVKGIVVEINMWGGRKLHSDSGCRVGGRAGR